MIETKRTVLDILSGKHAELVAHYYIENQYHLAPWEPKRPAGYFSLDNFLVMARDSELAFESGQECRFVAFNKDYTEVIGVCNFSCIVKGPFQACFLGYSVAKKYEGQGYMAEVLEAGISYVFEELGLNRIMANYMPANEASGKLLQRLGFEREGYANKYLKIAGSWEDHILTSKVNHSIN